MGPMLQVVLLLVLLVAATACQSQPTSPTAEVASLPAVEVNPGPTEHDDQSPVAEMASELTVNEDTHRSALFNINTLAYELPGMEEVEVLNIAYAYHGDRPLTLDIYYPPDSDDNVQLPVVIFGMGYRMSQEPLRNAHFYTSWGKLVAAARMVGIVYDTEQPDQDLETLLAFLQDHAAELRIDPAQIGFMSTSANTATVMSYLMQGGRGNIQFSVYYYGIMLTPDRKYTELLAEGCAGRGCLVTELTDVAYVDPELPILLVKAGRDHLPNLNEAMDHFAVYVREAGAPVTYVEYEDGQHGFDTRQQTEESAEIIAQTLAFMQRNFGME